jgi:exopolysaccharide production protein ExoZ
MPDSRLSKCLEPYDTGHRFLTDQSSASDQPLAAPKQTFEAVQILRGVAASMVVFHHAAYAITHYHPQHSVLATFYRLPELGAGGVDIFFVISGLVIAHAARKLPAGASSAREFAKRRLLRVLPPYWVFSFILIAMWWTGIGLKGLIMTPMLVVTSLLLIPYTKADIYGHVGVHPILDVGWTLTFEMYFYLLCSAVVWRVGGNRIFPWVFVLLALCAAASLTLTGFNSGLSSITSSPLLIEFAGGVLLAHFGTRALQRRTAWALITAGVAGLAASIFAPDPMAWRVLAWGVPGFLLVWGAIHIPVNLASAAPRFFVFLGTASYTIYLAHPFFVLAAGTILKRGLGHMINADLLLIILTLTTVFATACLYFVIERPLIQMFKPRSKPVDAALSQAKLA